MRVIAVCALMGGLALGGCAPGELFAPPAPGPIGYGGPPPPSYGYAAPPVDYGSPGVIIESYGGGPPPPPPGWYGQGYPDQVWLRAHPDWDRDGRYRQWYGQQNQQQRQAQANAIWQQQHNQAVVQQRAEQWNQQQRQAQANAIWQQQHNQAVVQQRAEQWNQQQRQAQANAIWQQQHAKAVEIWHQEHPGQ